MKKYLMLCGACSALAVSGQDSLYRLKMKLTGQKGNLESVAYSPDGKWLAGCGKDKNLYIYRADTPGIGNVVRVLNGHMSAVNHVAFSRDGKFVATASKDFTCRVYDAQTGALLLSPNDHKDNVTRVSFDPKSKYLLSASEDGTIRMYDLITPANNVKPKFLKYSGPVYGFAAAIDGKSYYIASNQATIDNIDFKGTSVRKLAGHTGQVLCVALSPDGKKLASGGADKTVIIWDLATGKAIYTNKAHGWKVTSVNWSADGKYLVSTGNEGETIVWDAESGKQLGKMKAMGNNARCAVFHPNNGMIAIATAMETDNHGPLLYSTPLTRMAATKAPAKAPVANAAPGKVATPAKPK
ncbi:MAG: WD40 repeat domain-containing protein [Bacteroidetes bacterium]|nr:WD40 repeat domain-containing protein [Bacteroidota bacterium]